MKAIIFSHLFERGKEVFTSSGIEFIVCPKRDETEFLALQELHRAPAVVLDSRPLSDSFFRALKPQTLIVRFGTGVDNIPFPICQERGHLIANTPGASTSSVSEYVFHTLGMLSQGIWAGHGNLVNREWIRPTGMEIRGKRLAVLGLGRIGMAVAKTAISHYGMEVIALCRSSQIPEKQRELEREKLVGVKLVDHFSDAVSGADFTTIHLSLNPDTQYLINKDTLGCFKKEAIIVNTARGKHIREIDLRNALHRKEIGGVVLDVFEQEPYKHSGGGIPELTAFPNVILTPHIAGHTLEANNNTSKMVVKNIRAFYEKKTDEIYQVNLTEYR